MDGLWPVLTRSTENTEKWDSLLPLPEPYVVPGGLSRGILLGQLLHHVRTCRKRSLG
ncbi:hypothetical protein ACVXHA_28050 [Escherichia coli]